MIVLNNRNLISIIKFEKMKIYYLLNNNKWNKFMIHKI